jgi:catechol 2,3-dioxygenase-like lactoylglutathione lyase family enzyme
MLSPLPIAGLHHVALVTRDPAASVAFYRDVLGFRPIRRPDFDFRGGWLFNYGLQIHVIERSTAGQAAGEIDPRASHLAFSVPDLAAMDDVERNLRGRGIACRRQINAGGIPQLFFRDPDGHHIEIGVYPPAPEFLE